MFTVKFNADSSVSRYKASKAIKGFTQNIWDRLCKENFALVSKFNSIKVISLATNLDWPLQQLDVKNAFRNRDLHEEAYKDPTIKVQIEGKLGLQVEKKSLYDLKQSPREQFKRFT